jgi:hypothetical protein
MLSLLGDAEAAESGGLVARLASLPYTLAIEAEEAVVDRAGVARMNAGYLHQLADGKPHPSAAVPLHEAEGSIQNRSGTTDQEPQHVP